MSAALPLPPPQTEPERIEQLYQAGRLRWKLLPHRRPTYDRFRRWNVERQTRAHHDWCADLGARFDRMWVDEAARRTAKTSSWLCVAEEECVRLANALGRGVQGMIAIPVAKKIGGVLVPNMKKIFRDAPRGYAPEYRASGQGEHEHLYIPAVESRVKLVGLDHHVDALRGPFLDFCIITEAAFVTTDLESTIVSEVMLQLQGLDHAWMVLESSAPKAVDHPFRRVFVVDAKARGAYSEQVITDNTSLTPEEIEDEIRMCGGRDSAICKRELFNIVEADPDDMVVPEFDEAVHVVDPDEWGPMPEHAMAHEGMDPGTTDPFGFVGLYFDFMRQVIVVQDAWQKPNASTGEVVARVKAFEAECWGTEHDTPETRRPNTAIARIASAQLTGGGKVWAPPPGSLTYWDESSWTLRPNPCSRISDVHARFILDLNRDYAMQVREAEKEPGSAEADLQYLRMLFAARHSDGRPKVVILRNGRTEPLIQQLRSGMWNTKDDLHRTDWARSKLLGHLDCLAALKYVVRDVRWKRNPFPPAIRDVNLPNQHVPEAVRKQMARTRPITPPKALGGYRSTWRQR